MRFHQIATALAIVIAPGAALHGADSLVGVAIYSKSASAQIKLGEKTIASGRDIVYPCRVRHDQGNWVAIMTKRGEGWIAKKEIVPQSEAVEYFTSVVSREPNNLHALLCRGYALGELRQYDRALEDLNKAIKLDPTSASAFNARGNAHAARKEFDKAITDYNEAIRLESGFAMAYYNRGNVRSDQREFAQAIADYNEAIKFDSKFAAAYGKRGNAHKARREYAEALADFDAVIRLDPKEALAWNNRGNVRLLQGDLEGAIEDYDGAIKLAPKYAPAYTNRGTARQARRDYAGALADFGEAIRIEPSDRLAYMNRAWLRATCLDEKYRDGKQAVADATRSCELTNWKNAQCIATLAAAHAEAGDFDAAAKRQSQALELAAGDDEFTRTGNQRLNLYRAGKPYREETR